MHSSDATIIGIMEEVPMEKRKLILPILFLGAICIAATSRQIKGSLDELEGKLLNGDLTTLPHGTQEYGNNYYLVVQKPMDWESAKQWCEERGGHLATILDADENRFCHSLVKIYRTRSNQYYHLGAKKDQGEWVWVTGEKVSFSRWVEEGANEDEHYLAFQAGEHNGEGWHDHLASDASIKGFVIEWEAPDPEPLLKDADSGFPEEMVAIHLKMQEALTEQVLFEQPEKFITLLKDYGRKIVAAEQRLSREDETEQLQAVRAVKANLVQLLNQASVATEVQPLPPTTKSIVLVSAGKPAENTRFDPDTWHKKDDALQSTKLGATLALPNLGIGNGDFRIHTKIQLSKIGGLGPKIILGETEFGIDGKETRAWMGQGAFFRDEHRGDRLGGVIDPEVWFEWVIERTGETIAMSIDDKEVMRKNATPMLWVRLDSMPEARMWVWQNARSKATYRPIITNRVRLRTGRNPVGAIPSSS